MMNKCEISVIESLDQLNELSPRWNALLETSISGSPFLQWEWISAWAECFLNKNRRLFVLVFHKNGKEIGIAPFYIAREKTGPFHIREVRFLGTPDAGSDYLDVFAKRGHEKEVADAFFHFLMGAGRYRWDQLSLQDIHPWSFFLLHFINRIRMEGKYVELAPSAYCPFIRLSNNFDEYFSGMSTKRRQVFRRDMRIINAEGKTDSILSKGVKAVRILPDFLNFYNQKSRWTGPGLNKMICQYAQKDFQQIPIEICFLRVDGKIVAASLNIKYKKVCALYLIAVDKGFNNKISLGNLLMGVSIRHAIESGYNVFDFLKGDESYKFHWANGGNRTLQLNFWNKRPAALLPALSRLIKNAGKLILR